MTRSVTLDNIGDRVVLDNEMSEGKLQSNRPFATKIAPSLVGACVRSLDEASVSVAPKRARLFDCFTFNNEFDLLRLRVALLRGVVDYFVIAEANRTHSGQARDLVLSQELIASLEAPIVVVVVDDMDQLIPADPGEAVPTWTLENHQRRSLIRGLERIGASQDDIVILTDADEIPSPEVVAKLDNLLGVDPLQISMRYMEYRFNLEIDWPWPLARSVRFRPGMDLQAVRERDDLKKIPEAGWHFTYLGSSENAQRKLRMFAHQELKGVYDSAVHLERCMRLHVDLMGRFPIRVRSPYALPPLVRSMYPVAPDLWATEHNLKSRLLSKAYRMTTRHRARLGQSFCDGHPLLAFVAALLLHASGKIYRRVSAVRLR